MKQCMITSSVSQTDSGKEVVKRGKSKSKKGIISKKTGVPSGWVFPTLASREEHGTAKSGRTFSDGGDDADEDGVGALDQQGDADESEVSQRARQLSRGE